MDNIDLEKERFKRQLQSFIADENAHNLYVTQRKVCFIILFRIYMRVRLLNKDFENIVIAEGDNLIIEGHHRYIAYRLAGKEIIVKKGVKNYCDQPPYLKLKDIIVDYEQDWDIWCPIRRVYCIIDF